MGVDDLRTIALALPGATEAAHFNLPSFRIEGKIFTAVQQDRTHALVFVGPAEAQAAAAADPAVFEETRRFDTVVAVRVDLSDVQADRLHRLVELAWRRKAGR